MGGLKGGESKRIGDKTIRSNYSIHYQIIAVWTGTVVSYVELNLIR